MARSYTYHGVTVSRKLSADEQRSLAMRLRNFSAKYKVGVSEVMAPVEVTSPPKLTVVYERSSAPRKSTPKSRPVAVKTAAKVKAQAWEDLKSSWTETREAETFVCRCGKPAFASEGGANYHKMWTTAGDDYGKAAPNTHYIPAIK